MKDQTIGRLFVAAQAVLLVGLVALPGRGDWPTPEWLGNLGLGLIFLGLLFMGIAALRLGSALTPTPVPVSKGQLATTGLYAYVRHPIYSGVLAVVAGITVRSGSVVTLVLALTTVAFFHLKASWEEARLLAKYPGYRDYAAATPRFFPRPWLR